MNLLALILGFLFTIISSDLKKKYFITLLIGVAGFIFYSSSSIFNGVKEATQDQAQFYKEDVRVEAHKYFLSELQGGIPTILFGNGYPSPSPDSKLTIEVSRGYERGFSTADVGLTGVFSYFGLLGVIIWLLYFYSVFKIHNNANTIYLKAYFIALLSTAITGYSIIDPGYMPATVLVLYLVRCETCANNYTVEAGEA